MLRLILALDELVLCSVQSRKAFLQNLQWPTIRDAINRYVDGELVATYTEQIIRDTIEMVWAGQL